MKHDRSPGWRVSRHLLGGRFDALANGLTRLSRSIYRLGNANASTPMGGLEGLGAAVITAAEIVGSALDNVADAVREARE